MAKHAAPDTSDRSAGLIRILAAEFVSYQADPARPAFTYAQAGARLLPMMIGNAESRAALGARNADTVAHLADHAGLEMLATARRLYAEFREDWDPRGEALPRWCAEVAQLFRGLAARDGAEFGGQL